MTTYTVIMAGGRGTRLWPVSRRALPKQFLPLAGGSRTLLQSAVDRAGLLSSPERIIVVTDSAYVQLALDQLPELPAENIVGEPVGKGTAACIGLAAIHIAAREPGSAMIVLAADHVISDLDLFAGTFGAAVEAVGEAPLLATVGLSPTRAETGYGYIRLGPQLRTVRALPVYAVDSFVEKPAPDLARSFVDSGNYLWNSGMFVWQIDAILSAFDLHMPALAAGLRTIRHGIETGTGPEAIASVYGGLKPVTIDYGVMEAARNVIALRGEFRWSDVGSWAALEEVSKACPDPCGVTRNALDLDSSGCIVRAPSGKLVVTIGLRDTVIIDTPAALLVCAADRAQDVKKIVQRLEEEGRPELL